MCYDSAFNYAVARCFSTELLRPSVHRMSTAAWMRSYSIFCFLLVVSHDMVQAMQQGQNCWWLRGFYFFAGLHHSTSGRCLVGTLCSGPVSSWMPCCPHLWTGKGTTLSVLESPQAVSLAKCFWFPYLQSSWFPTSDLGLVSPPAWLRFLVYSSVASCHAWHGAVQRHKQLVQAAAPLWYGTAALGFLPGWIMPAPVSC